jgi:hypothetical protein
LCAYDNVDNYKTWSGVYNLDKTSPTLTLNNASSSTYYNTPRATITASDSLSGLGSVYYRWNDNTGVNSSSCGGSGSIELTGFSEGSTSSFTSDSLTPPILGENTLYACVIDSAGNITASSGKYLYGDKLSLSITSVTGDANNGIVLTGSARGGSNGETMTVVSHACNTNNECIRREYSGFESSSIVTSQNFTLSFPISDLPTGTYNGTLWLSLTTSSGETLILQSSLVNFIIDPTIHTYPLTTLHNRPFNIAVGSTTNYDLGSISLPYTISGITATDTNNTLFLSSLTGLPTTGTVTATFGNTSFVVNVITVPPQAGIIEVSF